MAEFVTVAAVATSAGSQLPLLALLLPLLLLVLLLLLLLLLGILRIRLRPIFLLLLLLLLLPPLLLGTPPPPVGLRDAYCTSTTDSAACIHRPSVPSRPVTTLHLASHLEARLVEPPEELAEILRVAHQQQAAVVQHLAAT